VALGEGAGFVDIHLAFHVFVRPRKPLRWEVFLNAPGNPNIPALGEAMATLFTATETARYAARVRSLVESGAGTRRDAVAYLAASKQPGA
jgi:arsenite methyltransferase